MKLTVNGKGLHGTVPAIASRSMAHRLLICAALSGDPSQIRCETVSEDISATAECLASLGCELTYTGGTYYASPYRRPERASLDCKGSASTLRFLLPVICALGITARIEIQGKLPSRPLSPLYAELEKHGARMSPEGQSPMIVSGKLRGGTYTLRADTSPQLISGLLFALPLLEEDSQIILTGKRAASPHTEMTLSALRAYGIKINEAKDGYQVPAKQKYRSPGSVAVEGDWAAASFWLGAAAVGAPLSVTGLDSDSLQNERAVSSLLALLLSDESKAMIDARDVPDLVPILSVVAASQPKTTTIYNVSKESGRAETSAALVRAMGAAAATTEDGLRIKGAPEKLRPARIDSDNDPAIAMAAAIASFICGDVTILGANSVSRSYPSFFEDFRRLGGSVTSNL